MPTRIKRYDYSGHPGRRRLSHNGIQLNPVIPETPLPCRAAEIDGILTMITVRFAHDQFFYRWRGRANHPPAQSLGDILDQECLVAFRWRTPRRNAPPQARRDRAAQNNVQCRSTGTVEICISFC